MKIIKDIIVYQNPQPLLVSRQAVFPGVAQLDNGDLIALFSIGQAFDSADQRAYCCHSVDNGRHWTAPVALHEHDYGAVQHSETLKPLVLDDGTLIATGYAFLRPDALTPIVDEQTFAVLPMHNKISFSTDGGQNWTVPSRIDIEGKPLEMSGPCIQLASGQNPGCGSTVSSRGERARRVDHLQRRWRQKLVEAVGIFCRAWRHDRRVGMSIVRNSARASRGAVLGL
ncbi:sialidase family protein [Devosia algicola]|uniref:Sialidase family protein n=1 Tax=Devosia algicola TaxID=3026418 RepID=A0ABY7YMS6_9HYPH|nr:sialidase family protein [Devosia algicola]WDR02603.1 sialidase family protein [Devosia algicola]